MVCEMNGENIPLGSKLCLLHIYPEQCWAVTSYCNLVIVIILLFAVTSSVTNY